MSKEKCLRMITEIRERLLELTCEISDAEIFVNHIGVGSIEANRIGKVIETIKETLFKEIGDLDRGFVRVKTVLEYNSRGRITISSKENQETPNE